MNLISEELKKEAGLRIKASIVSSKLHLEYKINIYSRIEFDSKWLMRDHCLIDSIKFKIKYRISELEHDKAFIIYPKDSFYRSLSSKYGIKMDHIRTLYGSMDGPNSILETKDLFYHTNQINIGDCDWPIYKQTYPHQLKLDRVITSIHFTDPSWYRDYKINKILG